MPKGWTLVGAIRLLETNIPALLLSAMFVTIRETVAPAGGGEGGGGGGG